MSNSEQAVIFRNVTKEFPGVKALDNVSFSIERGNVHSIVGENGAGKSTLLNILHGIYSEYDGAVSIHGEQVNFKDAKEALSKGIVKVHQEVTMISELTVGQNIVLGYEPKKSVFVNNKKINQEVNRILNKLNVNFKSEDLARNLNIGEMQMASIAKALYHNASIISLDEPTASLSKKEITSLFEVMNELKRQNITIIFITHHLDEIFEISDSLTILRDGQCIDNKRINDINKEELVNKMVGRNVEVLKYKNSRTTSKDVVLKVDELSLDGVYRDISFHLNKGEILGFSGLVGSKRTDVMLTIFGALKKSSGDIRINDKLVNIKSPEQAVKHGIGLVPENRKTQGFNKYFNNSLNISLSHIDSFIANGFIKFDKIHSNSRNIGSRLNLRPNDPLYMTNNLSGGNQQKVVISKWLSADVDILIFDEPTKGVDVGAKSEIYQILTDLTKNGKSIIIVSSELSELMGIADRIIVMREGNKIIEMKNENLTEEKIIKHVMGV